MINNEIQKLNGTVSVGNRMEEIQIDSFVEISHTIVKFAESFGVVQHGAGTFELFGNHRFVVNLFHVMPKETAQNSYLILRAFFCRDFDCFA